MRIMKTPISRKKSLASIAPGLGGKLYSLLHLWILIFLIHHQPVQFSDNQTIRKNT
jgi:hypothetical protein